MSFVPLPPPQHMLSQHTSALPPQLLIVPVEQPSSDDSDAYDSYDSDEIEQLTDPTGLLMADPTAPTALETGTTGATGPPPAAEPTASAPHVKVPNDDVEKLSFAPPNSQQSSRLAAGPWFTLDDVPPSQWRIRIAEFKAWIDTQVLCTDVDSHAVLLEFVSRTVGTL